MRKKKKDYRYKSKIFYGILIAFPILQFCIFYIGVNMNSILMALKEYEIKEMNTITTWIFEDWSIIENFTTWFKKDGGRWGSMYSWGTIWPAFKASVSVYALSIFTGVPLGLLFSYYIYKKLWGASAFRVFLFLPSIIPGIVLVLMYRCFVDQAVPQYLQLFLGLEKTPVGLMSTNDQTLKFWTVAFYNIYVSFGTSVLMYSNKMATISPEIIEAAEIDGATAFKEFWHVVLPLTFPTLSIFLVTGVATLFTNQFNGFLFFNGYTDSAFIPQLKTIGFFIYDQAKSNADTSRMLTPLSALGLMLTAIAIPLTFGVRYLLNKFGPSEE